MGHAEAQFRLARIELVLTHPLHHGGGEILQRPGQNFCGKARLGAGIHQAVTESRGHFGHDPAHALTRFAGGEIAPALILGPQFLMKLGQGRVLETAAFPDVQFEELPFLGPQSGMDEKLKRAGRELLQTADGSVQGRAIQLRGQFRGKAFRVAARLE